MIIRLGISLFFAVWLQFLYALFANVDISLFMVKLPIYIVYLSVAHALVIRLYQPNYRMLLLLGGVCGCLLEWQVTGYVSMRYGAWSPLLFFVYHAVYPVMGVVFYDHITHSNLVHRVKSSFLYLSLFLPLGFFIMDESLQYNWLMWFSIAPYILSFTLIFFSRPLFKRIHA